MTNKFLSYALVGLCNSAIHWCVFGICFLAFNLTQSFSNLLGFTMAVIFSFFVNAKFTFKAQANLSRFILYTSFMACLSWATGYAADRLELHPLITLITFSWLSLGLGFLYSKFIVFK